MPSLAPATTETAASPVAMPRPEEPLQPDGGRTGAGRTFRSPGTLPSRPVASRAQRSPLDPRFLGGRHKHILYVTSEIDDYVKAGGLGEVSATLPRALRRHCDIRVLIPGYRQVINRHPNLNIVAHLPGYAGLPACDIGRVRTPDGLIIYIVKCPELYERSGTPYLDASGRDWQDNHIRFARLSFAAAEMAIGCSGLEWRPNFLHLNDWTSALTSGYLSWRGSATPSILTIHNLAYQGIFDAACLPQLGIPAHAYQIEGVEFYGRLSFLKAGIFYASHLTTVSGTYAAEITRPEFGCGLDGLLKLRAAQGRLTGILNGIDESWDPKHDPSLLKRFDAGEWAAKRRNSDYIRSAFGLAVSRGPLFAIVSRLVHQKGVDLAIQAAESIVEDGGQMVVTGQGEKRFEKAMIDLARRFPGSVGVRIGFDQEEARRMFAGSDFLLMPSRFEPCGLSQMYAQRFGSLPIAHKTGGLADTIEDGLTGFLFSDLSLPAFVTAIRRAMDTYASRRRINKMRREAMSRSFGWQRSAAGYDHVYSVAGIA